jgi:hypothetical protein
MNELPIVCTLSPNELRQRTSELLPGLIARADERIDLADGYRWQFTASPGILTAIAAAIEAERSCCQFLKFTFTAEPGLGPVSLDVTGPRGTKEFLEELLGRG